MSETCGGCAAISQRTMFAPTSKPIDELKDSYKQWQTERNDNRKSELLAKKENGNLNSMEQIELIGLNAAKYRDELARMGGSTICYSC